MLAAMRNQRPLHQFKYSESRYTYLAHQLLRLNHLLTKRRQAILVL